MKSKCSLLFSFLLIMINITFWGCAFLNKTQTNTTIGTSDKEQSIITGVVVLGINKAVPDSFNCTVKYFDYNINNEVIKTLKNGVFYLDNLADGKYKLEAVTKVGDLKGSINFSIRDGSLMGSTKEKNVLRLELGRENVQEAPVPPDYFEPDVNSMIGIIRDNL